MAGHLDATPVNDSPWHGKAAIDLLGRPVTVRRVYDVAGQHVAVLTSDVPACEGGEAICAEHVDLLATADQPPAFPDFRATLDRLADLEDVLHSSDATEADVRRFRALTDTLKPYMHAESRLKQALVEQAQPGDRVYLTGKDFYATIIDPDSRPWSDLPRSFMRVRLDEVHLRNDPYLLERHTGGLVELSTLMLWPTLGLI